MKRVHCPLPLISSACGPFYCLSCRSRLSYSVVSTDFLVRPYRSIRSQLLITGSFPLVKSQRFRSSHHSNFTRGGEERLGERRKERVYDYLLLIFQAVPPLFFLGKKIRNPILHHLRVVKHRSPFKRFHSSG